VLVVFDKLSVITTVYGVNAFVKLVADVAPDNKPALLYTNPEGSGVDPLTAYVYGAVPVPACTDTGLNAVNGTF